MFEATNNLFFVIMNDFHVIFLTTRIKYVPLYKGVSEINTLYNLIILKGYQSSF